MKRQQAFTIFELLIAMSLSSVVIVGLLQAYNNIMVYLKYVQEMQHLDRKVCLLFNQIERDFTTAFIPPLLEKIEPVEEEERLKPEQKKESEPKTAEAKKKEEEEKLEKLKIYFLAKIDEDGIVKRINEHRTHPFKSVTLINTNPLQVYGKHKVRLVRVLYELVVDKQRSKGDKLCYNLWRRETEDLDNVKVKEDELGVGAKEKYKQIRKHLVTDGIKDLFIQYIYQGVKKPKEGEKEIGEEEIEEKFFDTWGDEKEIQGIVPCRINIYVSFWNDDLSKSMVLQTTFPILSFSLVKEREKSKRSSPQTGSGKTSSPVQQSQQSSLPPGGGKV